MIHENSIEIHRTLLKAKSAFKDLTQPNKKLKNYTKIILY